MIIPVTFCWKVFSAYHLALNIYGGDVERPQAMWTFRMMKLLIFTSMSVRDLIRFDFFRGLIRFKILSQTGPKIPRIFPKAI